MLIQMDSRGVIGTAFRQLYKFAFVFVPVVLLTIVYLVISTRYYESNATLLVKFGQDARPEVAIQGVPNSGLSAEERRGLVQSNLNILESRDLAESLVRSVGVNRLYPHLAENIEDPEKRVSAAIRQVMGDIKASSHSDSGTIRIALVNEDPVVANDALRRFIDIYIQKQAEIFGNPQSDVLADQAHQSYVNLDAANRKLTDFKVANNITSLEEELSLLLKQRGDLAGYLARRQDFTAPVDPSAQSTAVPATEQSDYQASSARIGASGEGGRFPVLEDIQRRIDELNAKEAALLQTYRPNSDIIKTLRRNIETEQKNLSDAVAALKGQIEDLDRQILQKQAHRAEYDNLVRAVKVSEEAYKTAQDRLLAAQVNDDLNQRKITRISVIQQPIVPEKPAYPNKILVLFIGGLVAGFLGVAVALLAELLDQTFWRSEQLAAVLGRPVLASFIRRQNGAGQYKGQELSALYQTVVADTVQSGKIVAVAGCQVSNATADLSSSLADYAATTLGRDVLLIDAASAPSGRESLLGVVTGRCQFDAAVERRGKTVILPLAAAGEADRIISVLPDVRKLLDTIRTHYPVVIVSAPNIAAQPSLQSFVRLVDGVVLVVEAEQTRAPVVTQISDQLADASVKLLGAVLHNRRLYIPSWIYSRL